MSEFITEEFLHDFYQEASEHLARINQCLLELEQVAPRVAHDLAAADRENALLDDLFRAYHTLKGLCGMVGLEEGADLGHALESTLRAIQKGRLKVDADLIDLLLEGSRRLEAIVATVQDASLPMPRVDDLVARLEASRGKTADRTTEAPRPLRAPVEQPSPAPTSDLLPTLPPPMASQMDEADWRKVARALAEGLTCSLVLFEPSPEKAARGVNVNVIRERLQAAGRMLKAVPIVEGRTVRFGFLVAAGRPLAAADFPDVEVTPLPAAPSEPEAAVPQPSVEAAPAPLRRIAPSSAIRVEVERLEQLMALVGDLVVSRSRLQALLKRLDGTQAALREELEEEVRRMGRQLTDLREAVMRVRLVPLSEVFGRMPLAVRDVARALGREVQVVIEGETTEIDKQVADRLLDPLLHLVRNAVTHGIEAPEARQAAGKPRKGTLTLRGRAEGDTVVVEVADDGRGLDLARIAQKAVERGWLEAERPLTPDEALEFITRPGFTTRDQADRGAGRGVGMDVVARTLAELGGSLSLDTVPGQGTTFTLYLPLTVTIVDALVVEVAGQRFAIPLAQVRQALEIEPQRVVHHRGMALISLQGQALPLLSLAALFALPADTDERYGLRVRDRGGEAVLLVHRLADVREVVVRPIQDPLIARPGIGGVTELGDGSVILILDVPGLLRFVRERRPEDGNGHSE